jgi:hypothetical protein
MAALLHSSAHGATQRERNGRSVRACVRARARAWEGGVRRWQPRAPLVSELGSDALERLVDQLPDQRVRHHLAVVQECAVLGPLPHLRTRQGGELGEVRGELRRVLPTPEVP